MTTPAIALRDSTWGYRGRAVLRHIDLDVLPGEFVGIVGPSGSGKSTLVRAVTGVAQRLGGSGEVFGAPVGTAAARRRIGYVPQIGTLDVGFPLTVDRLAVQGLTPAGPSRPWLSRDERERVAAVLDRLEIGHLSRRPLAELSGGELQRAFLARALLRAPDVLLLDEPTSGVDLQTRHEVLHLLGELHGRGTTIVLTTHDLNFVAAHLPRIVCLNERIIADGTPDAVFRSEVIEQTYGAAVRIIRDAGMVFVADPTHVLAGGHHAASDHPTPLDPSGDHHIEEGEASWTS